MKKILFVMYAALCVAMHTNAQVGSRKTCIDRDWRFCYGDGSVAIADANLANAWRKVDLPHDWSVETDAARAAGGTVIGPFSTNSVGKYQTGHTVGGEGWYKKDFWLTADDLKDSRLELYFEGAYNQTEVYVNGRKMYFNHYGYSSFRFDVTDAVKEGHNALVVRVTNEGNNTRWYAGSGIYRHVWMVRTPSLHVDEWDTYIQPDGDEVQVLTGVYNDGKKAKNGVVQVEIKDAEGKVVASSADVKVKMKAGESKQVSVSLALKNARKWSPDTPYLYSAVIRMKDAKTKQTDELVKRFGVRTLEFSAEKGFLLNGEETLLRGGCVHHDNGLLGAAAYDCAEDRKLSLMKAQGYNAVRCSHNIPSEHFLDACDELGIMVIDEAFDQWLRKKNTEDYHRYFEEYCEQDLSVMVRRDRNHPSIIMWSIGNEIPGRIEPAGIHAAERLRETVRRYDTTRPVTAAICGWDEGDEWNAAVSNDERWSKQDNNAFKSLDVGGYNYLFFLYERDHGTHPDRVMFGAESYPKQASENWNMVERLPYVIGDFVWTAMDYLGEAGIGSASFRKEGSQSMFQEWPWYNGWCGDIDLIGQKKPQSYYRDVVWHRTPITMAVERPAPEGTHQSVSWWGWQLEEQCWTYPDLAEGAPMTVNVYSRSPKVRLYLNDELVGEKETSNTFLAAFSVGYRQGTLRAVEFDGNSEGASYELTTTGKPASFRLIADCQSVKSNGTDLAYVTIELIDNEGRVITYDNSTTVSISATGDGILLTSGNASPTDMESFRSTTPRLHNGRAMAILKAGDKEGGITLTVQSDGFPSASVSVPVVGK